MLAVLAAISEYPSSSTELPPFEPGRALAYWSITRCTREHTLAVQYRNHLDLLFKDFI